VGAEHCLLAGHALLSGTVNFSQHPRYSLVCILAVILFNVIVLGLLRRARSRVDINLLARKTAATCCNSPAGDCH
jgi:ferrous iron transport protein B